MGFSSPLKWGKEITLKELCNIIRHVAPTSLVERDPVRNGEYVYLVCVKKKTTSVQISFTLSQASTSQPINRHVSLRADVSEYTSGACALLSRYHTLVYVRVNRLVFVQLFVRVFVSEMSFVVKEHLVPRTTSLHSLSDSVFWVEKVVCTLMTTFCLTSLPLKLKVKVSFSSGAVAVTTVEMHTENTPGARVPKCGWKMWFGPSWLGVEAVNIY